MYLKNNIALKRKKEYVPIMGGTYSFTMRFSDIFSVNESDDN